LSRSEHPHRRLCETVRPCSHRTYTYSESQGVHIYSGFLFAYFQSSPSDFSCLIYFIVFDSRPPWRPTLWLPHPPACPPQVELSQLQRTTYRSILERNFDWLNRGRKLVSSQVFVFHISGCVFFSPSSLCFLRAVSLRTILQVQSKQRPLLRVKKPGEEAALWLWWRKLGLRCETRKWSFASVAITRTWWTALRIRRASHANIRHSCLLFLP
jgi:hypothetical protein